MSYPSVYELEESSLTKEHWPGVFRSFDFRNFADQIQYILELLHHWGIGHANRYIIEFCLSDERMYMYADMPLYSIIYEAMKAKSFYTIDYLLATERMSGNGLVLCLLEGSWMYMFQARDPEVMIYIFDVKRVDLVARFGIDNIIRNLCMVDSAKERFKLHYAICGSSSIRQAALGYNGAIRLMHRYFLRLLKRRHRVIRYFIAILAKNRIYGPLAHLACSYLSKDRIGFEEFLLLEERVYREVHFDR